jgi:hypothetical protein
MAGTDEERRISALELISSDLEDARRVRRRHFMPALAIAVVMVAATIGVMGMRPDLFSLPLCQLALLVGLWVLCLVVFPAIGVGLLFVSRGARLGLALLAVLGTFSAVTGWPFVDHVHTAGTTMDGMHGMHACFGVALSAGILVLAVGLLSGAFSQRRRAGAVYWVASGMALMALNVATWHCPGSTMAHIVPNHVGAAAALMLLAVVAGLITRHREARGAA